MPGQAIVSLEPGQSPRVGVVPSVSVIVSTRNRPEHIVQCVQSVLASPDSDFELVVVDQSDTDESRRIVEAAVSDDRLRWVSTKTKGLSISRNIGVKSARAPVIAFTDDDCRVSPDWVSGLRDLFATDREAALVFGRVLRSAKEASGGFAAEFDPAEPREYRGSFPHVLEAWGIGANMTLRREVLNRIGPFDPALGAGALFRAGEDADITIRVIAAGFKLLHVSGATVTHLGVRHGTEASHLLRGYGVGLGATIAKHVRLGTKGSGRLLADWIALQGQRCLGNAIFGRRPTGIGMVASSIWGAGRSCVHGIDRSRSIYVPEAGRSE